MKETSIFDSNTISHILDFLNNNQVILLEFPNVYGLIASSSEAGVQSLNKAKSRKPNKYYGSIMGSLENAKNLFYAETKTSKLIQQIDLQVFNNSFLRLNITSNKFSSGAIRQGTHQLFLSSNYIKDIAIAVEANQQKASGNPLFNQLHYFAPLCTSANISGDKNGSIIGLEKALEFGKQQNIGLFVHAKKEAMKSGSYSIFSLESGKVELKRNSKDSQSILEKIPQKLTLM